MMRLILTIACLFLLQEPLQAQGHTHAPPGSTCIDQEDRLSYKGFKHCEYHSLYQTSFKDWNCQCYSGQCRPTEFRVAPVTATNQTGLEVQINGSWFPIPQNALRKERANMSPDLLKWMAHACANDPTFEQLDEKTIVVKAPPHIECVWINTGS